MNFYDKLRAAWRNNDSLVCVGLDPDASYHVEVIDTWNMTIDDRGIMKGRFHLDLPGKEFIAIRVVKVKSK